MRFTFLEDLSTCRSNLSSFGKDAVVALRFTLPPCTEVRSIYNYALLIAPSVMNKNSFAQLVIESKVLGDLEVMVRGRAGA